MVKHTQTNTNCLSMFDDFVGLALRGLIAESYGIASHDINESRRNYKLLFYILKTSPTIAKIFYNSFLLKEIKSWSKKQNINTRLLTYSLLRKSHIQS